MQLLHMSGHPWTAGETVSAGRFNLLALPLMPGFDIRRRCHLLELSGRSSPIRLPAVFPRTGL